MKRNLTIAAALIAVVAFGASAAYAQSYSFQLEQEVVDVFLESDGTYRLVYAFVFANDPGASPIDFVDVGMPSSDYDLSSIRASVDGKPVSDIATSPYVTPGVAVGLGNQAIPSGQTGTLLVEIGRVGGVLFRGDEEGYASAKFSPTWFDSQFVHGSTDLTVTFHLPPGVQPEEPRWHAPEGGWPSGDPATGFDAEGRIVYTWRDTSARGDTQYTFGASFPSNYVPSGSLSSPPSFDWTFLFSGLVSAIGCLVPVAFFIFIIVLIFWAGRRGKLAYLPPKIAVEGHGIKRGLTAVEAAVLLETGLDKVLTMILFSLIKKGAARVVRETPLKVEPVEPRPAELRAYEESFLAAVVLDDARKRQRQLTEVMIQLVKAVESKMKGFSLKETRDYYRAIIQKAWEQVEAAQTPEVKSEVFTDSLEWTMLDRDFDGHTRRTFGTGPVYFPIWWGSYRPTTVSAPSMPISVGRGGGAISLPHLPGAEFAASFARGVQNTAGSLVSNITEFTSGVTRTTNPPPPPSSRSGSSGGRSCACACACAGCACACAGGGR